MLKNIIVLGVSSLFIFSCSTKSAVKDEAMVASVSVEEENNNQMFSASGSDYNQAGELNTVYFEYDKSNLTSLGKDILKNNYNWLKDNPDVFIQVEGHCDNRGTIEYNIALGERRAISIKNYLKRLGLKDSRIATISYGEEKPFSLDDSESGWAKNRRVNFVIISR